MQLTHQKVILYSSLLSNVAKYKHNEQDSYNNYITQQFQLTDELQYKTLT